MSEERRHPEITAETEYENSAYQKGKATLERIFKIIFICMTSLKIEEDLLNYILRDMIGNEIEGVGRRHMKRANEIRAEKE